jgi:general L-amino acid transport system permease protein
MNYFKEITNNNLNIIKEILSIIIIFAIVWIIVKNIKSNIEDRGINTGFDFLNNKAGFDIQPSLGNHLTDYSPESTNFGALKVGIINTLFVTGISVLLVLFLRYIIYLSNSYHIFPNIINLIGFINKNLHPLFLILFFYKIFLSLPHPKQSLSLFDLIFINNRGICIPKPIFEDGFMYVPIFFFSLLFIFNFINIGISFKIYMGIVFLLSILLYLILGAPLSFDHPVLGKFNLKGGLVILPEFNGMTCALAFYYSTYPTNSLKEIIISILKMSSISTIIGYPELMSVFGGTVLNQVGQAIEILFICILIYLGLIGGINLISKFICYKFVGVHLLGKKFGFI